MSTTTRMVQRLLGFAAAELVSRVLPLINNSDPQKFPVPAGGTVVPICGNGFAKLSRHVSNPDYKCQYYANVLNRDELIGGPQP